MSIESISGIGSIPEIQEITGSGKSGAKSGDFVEALREAVNGVDELQKEGAEATGSFARGEQVDLHDVLVKIEEADIAFRAMMEVRNKLVDAYRQVMRLGSGG